MPASTTSKVTQSTGYESFRFAGIVVFFVGLGILLAGELLGEDTASRAGVWVLLTAFPVHALYRLARYVDIYRQANREIDSAVQAARDAGEPDAEQ